MVVLAGCVSRHINHPGDDAALVRFSQSDMQLVKPTIHPIEPDGTCGQPAAVATLYPPGSERAAEGPASTWPVPRPRPGARERMLGSPPAERTDVTEIRLAPGRYGFLQNAAWGTHSCASGVTLSIEPRQQYWLDIALDGATCRTTLRRVVAEAGTLRWAPVPVEQAQTIDCKP